MEDVNEGFDIWSNIKRGWKVGIGQEINQEVRDYVFIHDWDINNEVADKLTQRLCCNYLVIQSLELTNDELARKRFVKLLRDKIKDAFKKFAAQKPTPKQIYYYVGLCDEVGEPHQKLMTNIQIHQEIDRLVELKEEKREME